MSAFYDLASLVLVPSGYKASKVYAQKPLTTDGQLTFSRASTATRVNSAGLIETVSSNVPRLDYQGSTCPKLLLEPQRVNLRTHSSDFSVLSPSNVTVDVDNTTSPDGTINADKITPSGSGFHTIGNTISVTSGQKYTISVFYKYGTHKNIGFYDNNTAGSEITINMETNAFTLGGSVDAGGVIPYGNGWYRAYATFTAGSSNMVNYIIFRDNTNNGNYTGDGSYSWFYGWQVEAGTYPTSYIPTTSAAVTRLADACSKTGISSLIGQTEGTLFADVEINNIGQAADRGIVSVGVNGAGYTSAVYISFYGNDIYLACFVAGSPQIASVSKTITTAGRYKIAAGYKDNDFVLYVNGQLAGSDNSGSLPSSMSVFTIDGINQGFNGYHTYNESMVFASRLTNAQLAELTTL